MIYGLLISLLKHRHQSKTFEYCKNDRDMLHVEGNKKKIILTFKNKNTNKDLLFVETRFVHMQNPLVNG